MSVLFNALRRAEAENRAGESAAAIPLIGGGKRPARRRTSPALLLVLLLLVGAGGAFLLFPDEADELLTALVGDQPAPPPPRLLPPATPAVAAEPAPPSPAPAVADTAAPAAGEAPAAGASGAVTTAPSPIVPVATAESPAAAPVTAIAAAASPPAPAAAPAEPPPAEGAARPPAGPTPLVRERVVGPPPQRDPPRSAEVGAAARPPANVELAPPAEVLAADRALRDPESAVRVAREAPAAPARPPRAVPPAAETGPSIARLQDNAYRALTEGNFQGALRLYDQILARERDNRSALLGKAVSLQRLGLTNSAREVYEQVLAIDPANRTAMANLLALMSESQPQAALTQLQRLESANPTSAPIVAQLGLVLAQQGDLVGAARRLQLAASIAPENPVYRLNLAIVYDRAGRRADAMAAYSEVLSLAAAAAEPLPMALDDVRRRLSYLASLN